MLRLATLLMSSFTAAVLGVAQVIQQEQRSLDQIYEVARHEKGILNVYFGGSSQAAALPLINAFQARFPDVAINITAQLSKYASARIDRSYLVNSPYIDVALLQTLQDFPRWDKMDRLLHYKPAHFDDVNLAIKDANGAFWPISYNQFGPFYYDSTKVPADKIPETYNDILDPYWKGKIVLTYPNDDDGVLYLFRLIVARYGFAWLDALLEQDVQWVRGATLATGTIIDNHANNGDRVLTFSGLGGFTPSTDFLKVKQPVSPEQFMTWAQQAAIFKSTSRPESAKLLASFLLSDEWQGPIAARGTPSIRTSFNKGPGTDVFGANNTQPSGYIDFMTNREEVEWWRFQMELSIGLARGEDPTANSELRPN